MHTTPVWKKLLIFAGVFTLIATLTVVWLFKWRFFESATEKHLRKSLPGSSAIVTLPAQVSGSTWQEALVVCPYTEASAVPAPYQASLAKVSTASESYNWVLYRLSDGSVVSHEVARSTANFCGTEPFFLVTPACEFKVEWPSGEIGTLLHPKC